MKHTKQKWIAALLALCLLLSLTAPAMAMQPDEAEDTETVLSAEETPADETVSDAEKPAPEEVAEEEAEASDTPEPLAAGTEVTVEHRSGYDVATVHYTDVSGTEQSIEFRETENGYAYTLPQGVAENAVTVEYFSTTEWDGAVDISWYDAGKSEFTLTTPAQLAGLAALVNGRTSAETSRWRIKGDTALLVSTRKDNVIIVGAGGGNLTGTVYYASADYDFSGKTVYLGCDMDMGGSANWTPIGGKYPMDPGSTNDPVLIEAFFNGTLDGQGHRITNLSCDRYSAKHFAYSQAIGLVGYLGELYTGESAPARAPTVRNLSVDGSIHGRRMVGGIVGRVGSIGTGVRIENCANHAAVSSTDAKGVGGIVGAGWGKGYIINCYNTGSVTAAYACPAGGICGNNQGLNIYACYNVGTIDTSGNQRGRGIGGHDSGTYTVANCYTLSGCDDDPASNGWYVGSGTSCTIDIGVWTKTKMQSQSLLDALNANGGAYVYNAGGYPKLFWESGWPSGTCQVNAVSAGGVTVTATPSGTVAKGMVVYLSNTAAAGSLFRYYTANGQKLLGDYYTATADVTLSAMAEGMVAGTVYLQESSVYTIDIKKTGTVYEGGTAVSVTDYSVVNGDPIYENDVLTVTATVRDGAYPADNNYVYSGKFDYIFTYQDGSDPETKSDVLSTTFTVARADAPLMITATAITTAKTWLQVADTSWYSSSGTEFTLTTARQLAGLAQLVKDRKDTFSGKTIRLGNDISLRNDDGTHGTRLWGGIGSSGSFNGTFDGAGHAITQMTASATGNIALFVTCNGATIKDLSLYGSATGSRAAGLVLDMTNTTVENCAVSVTVTASGNNCSGGIAGAMNGGAMTGCVNRSAVTGKDGVGALAGELKGGGIIQDCANYGAVSGNGTSGGLGGLVGKVIDSSTLQRCANYGAVSGTSWYTGGLVGSCSSGTITDCYNTAAVTGGHATRSSACVGGLVGNASIYTMTNCFNSGTVSVGSTYGTAGGVFGNDERKNGSSSENLWYLNTSCTAACGSTTNAAITDCAAAQLADGTVLNAINGNGSFEMNDRGYPELKNIPNAYTIRGRVDAEGRSVTVILKDSSQTLQTLTGVTGDFQFSLRAHGSYSLLLEAEGCVSHPLVVPQDSGGAVGTVVLRRAGDVNMDGTVDVYDLQRLYEHAAKIDLLTDDYTLLLGDVNGDGGITATDLQRLYEQLTGAA